MGSPASRASKSSSKERAVEKTDLKKPKISYFQRSLQLKRKGYLAIVYALMSLILGVNNPVFAQREYPERLLEVKRRFTEQELAALAKPFVGISSNGQTISGLYPVVTTSVSIEPIRESAIAFLKSLTPIQKIRTQFSISDSEWRRWSNVDNGIYVRQGVSLREMIYESSFSMWTQGEGVIYPSSAYGSIPLIGTTPR